MTETIGGVPFSFSASISESQLDQVRLMLQTLTRDVQTVGDLQKLLQSTNQSSLLVIQRSSPTVFGTYRLNGQVRTYDAQATATIIGGQPVIELGTDFYNTDVVFKEPPVGYEYFPIYDDTKIDLIPPSVWQSLSQSDQRAIWDG